MLADSFRIRMDAHHHEVATAGQGEINIRFDELIPRPTTSRMSATS